MGAIKLLDQQWYKFAEDRLTFKHHQDQIKKIRDEIRYKPVTDPPKWVSDPQNWPHWGGDPGPEGVYFGQYPFALAFGHQFGPLPDPWTALTEKEKLAKTIEGFDSLIDSTRQQMEYMRKQLDEMISERDSLKEKAAKE